MKKYLPYLLLAGGGVALYFMTRPKTPAVNTSGLLSDQQKINALLADVTAANWTPGARSGFQGALIKFTSQELDAMYQLLHLGHFAGIALPSTNPLWQVWAALRVKYPSFWP